MVILSYGRDKSERGRDVGGFRGEGRVEVLSGREG